MATAQAPRTFSQRASDTLAWLDTAIPRFFDAYGTVVDETASRVENVSLKSLRLYLSGTAYSVKAIFTDIHQLTQAEFSFSDYFHRLVQGRFIPGTDCFRVNGESRHFWDLAIRVTSISLLIISGVSGLFAWKSIKGIKKPLVKMWNFGSDALSWFRLFTLTGSAALLPFITLYSLILSCDLQKLALLLTMIEDPFNLDEWHSEFFRNGDTRFKLTDFSELKAHLSQILGQRENGPINAALESTLRKNGTTPLSKEQFKRFVGENDDAKRAYEDYEKSALSLIMKSWRVGDLSFLGRVVDGFAPHISSAGENPLDRVNPLLRWAFRPIADHREATRVFNARFAAMADLFDGIFTTRNQTATAARIVARTAPQTVAMGHRAIRALEGPRNAVTALHTSALVFSQGITGPVFMLVSAATTINRIASRVLAPCIHRPLAFLGLWADEDAAPFKQRVNEHLLLWGTVGAALTTLSSAENVAPSMGAALAKTAIVPLVSGVTATLEQTVANGQMGESLQRVSENIRRNVRSCCSRTYNLGEGGDNNLYYIGLVALAFSFTIRLLIMLLGDTPAAGLPLNTNQCVEQ